MMYNGFNVLLDTPLPIFFFSGMTHKEKYINIMCECICKQCRGGVGERSKTGFKIIHMSITNGKGPS